MGKVRNYIFGADYGRYDENRMMRIYPDGTTLTDEQAYQQRYRQNVVIKPIDVEEELNALYGNLYRESVQVGYKYVEGHSTQFWSNVSKLYWHRHLQNKK